jgi:biotin carboxyl carrier protein
MKMEAPVLAAAVGTVAETRVVPGDGVTQDQDPAVITS